MGPDGINHEIRNRIRLSVAALAYELHDDPVMSDSEFDKLAYTIRPHEKTGRATLDRFFRTHFEPDSGVWVRRHPEIGKLNRLYFAHYREDRIEDLL